MKKRLAEGMTLMVLLLVLWNMAAHTDRMAEAQIKHFLRPVLRQRTDHHPFDVVLTASGRRPMAENRHYGPRPGDLWLPALPLCPAPHPML